MARYVCNNVTKTIENKYPAAGFPPFVAYENFSCPNGLTDIPFNATFAAARNITSNYSCTEVTQYNVTAAARTEIEYYNVEFP